MNTLTDIPSDSTNGSTFTYAPAGGVSQPPPPDMESIFAGVYDRLKTLARREIARSSKQTLNTTALVHEVYLKMCVGKGQPSFAESVKFFSYAAMAMRHILTDRAVRRSRDKHGGKDIHVEMSEENVSGVSVNSQIALLLDSALTELEKNDARAAKVVELHYFAGLSFTYIGTLLGVTRRTVDRDWRYARAFLEARVIPV